MATGESGGPATTPEEIRALARRAADRPDTVRPTRELTPWEELRQADYRQDMRLREKYANWLLWGLGAELVIVNLLFWLYAAIGMHWRIPSAAIEVWLGATVVQVVGIVAIVARYLFPRRDTSASSRAR